VNLVLSLPALERPLAPLVLLVSSVSSPILLTLLTLLSTLLIQQTEDLRLLLKSLAPKDITALVVPPSTLTLTLVALDTLLSPKLVKKVSRLPLLDLLWSPNVSLKSARSGLNYPESTTLTPSSWWRDGLTMVTTVLPLERVVPCLPEVDRSAPSATLAQEVIELSVLLVNTVIGLVILETVLPTLPLPPSLLSTVLLASTVKLVLTLADLLTSPLRRVDYALRDTTAPLRVANL
jgi:hypothetical protein